MNKQMINSGIKKGKAVDKKSRFVFLAVIHKSFTYTLFFTQSTLTAR